MNKEHIYYIPYSVDICDIMGYCAQYGYYFDTPRDAAEAWKSFSDSYCANWLICTEYYLEQFISFLAQEIGNE